MTVEADWGGKCIRAPAVDALPVLRCPDAALTLPLALGGAWTANWWGVLFGIGAMVLTVQSARQRSVPFLIVALPGWFMLLLHGAIAVNQERYNFYLMVPYALAGAWIVMPWIERLRETIDDRRSSQRLLSRSHLSF